jgi:subtilisin-like proprotein convertase family protein
LLSLLLFAASYWMWTYAEKVSASDRAHAARAVQAVSAAVTPPSAPGLAKAANAPKAAKAKSYRVSNTRRTEGQLVGDDHAIILRNALIDTRLPLKLDIPAHLRAKGAPGSYIVQSDRPLDQRFYDRLKKVGAAFVSYIPNNAALVRATPEQAGELAGDATIQAVLPWEPYYKLDAPLLPAAVEQQQAQSGALNVTTYPGQRDAALAALRGLGATYMGEDNSPFGVTLTVMAPPDKLSQVAQLPLAQEVESYAPRRALNDLTRVAMGISSSPLYTASNYMGLTGQNVTVNMNDTGVDSTHPDFAGAGGVGTTRLEGATDALADYNGHGTHVAGIIMGNGSQSTSISAGTNPIPGSVVGAGFQGKATNAYLFVQSLALEVTTTIDAAFREGGSFASDAVLQTNASIQLGPTNLISNNSWGYDGIYSYDMHAASFDQATRDAQPGAPGEQPLLFVFAAGDAGDGNNNGGGGASSTILSPGTAKNVITVGAIDSARFITNQVTFDNVNTNAIFYPWTDNNDLVAWFSSCGNVSPGTEGLSGRFKPDVVAPGVFIISCRASNYVDPTYSTQVTPYSFASQTILPGATNLYTLPMNPSNFPADTEELVMQATPNSQSPVPFPPLVFLGAQAGSSLAPLLMLTTNFTVLTNNLDGIAWNFGVASTNGQIQPVSYDLTFYLVETNDLGVSISNQNGYYYVISNLNKSLDITKPGYVYQYGTSMAAGAVSGMLALMQQFLQTNTVLRATNPSPALLKAMLINGSRSVNQQYDFNTYLQTMPVETNASVPGANEQGWGLPNLPDTLPLSLTSNNPSLVVFDQSATNALASGQWQSFTLNDDPNLTNYPVRVTLVWTDPPGDPAAGIALVNNLDLLVTDATGTNMWLGNDFYGGDIFTEVNTGDLPDFINNAQNVYIDSTNTPFVPPLTVTVLGPRVNVNAATTVSNRIAQDFALVISSDNPALTAPLTATAGPVSSGPLTLLTAYAGATNVNGTLLLSGPLTNFLTGSSALVTIASNAAPLLDQRVGANAPNLYANGSLYPTNTDTNGSVAQWHFFVFTNDQSTNGVIASNVAFATFYPPNLATQITPRTNGADIDLYVSTNSGLTNLDTNIFALMTSNDISLGRGGNEAVVYSNQLPNLVYYIGVKSEDQQAADFGFYAIAQQPPFSSTDINGNIIYTYHGPPVTIPDAFSFGVKPPPVLVFSDAISPLSRNIREVTVSLTIDHANPGDLYGVFAPGQPEEVVLNNFTGPEVGQIMNVTYNDLDDNTVPGAVNSDGPGTLRSAISQTIPTFWLLQETDNALLQGGDITGFSVTVSPQPNVLDPVVITLLPNTVYFSYVVVPTDVIYLTNAVTLRSGSAGTALAIYMSPTNGAATNTSDGTNIVFNTGGGVQTPGGYLLVGTNSIPIPLSGGTWYYGIYNNTDVTVTFTNQIFFDYNLVPNLVQIYTNNTLVPLPTDATTNSSQICISNGQQLLDLSVGVRLEDTNLDDLVLELTSPQGTTIVLFENRGGLAANSLGLTLSNGQYIYTTFTEDTNLTGEDIKFAPPPYATPVVLSQTNIYSGSFDSFTNLEDFSTNGSTVISNAAGNYTNGQYVAGWLVETNLLVTNSVPTNMTVGSNTIQTNILVTNQVLNEVSVVTDLTQTTNFTGTNAAATNYLGSNYLALASGRLSQTFPTVSGASYEFVYYARSPGLTDWWPADDNTIDLINASNSATIPYSDVTFNAGEVDRAFTFSGVPTNNPPYNGNEVDFGTNAANFGTNAFTIDFWIKMPTSATGLYGILEKRQICQATPDSYLDIHFGQETGFYPTTNGHFFVDFAGNSESGFGVLIDTNSKPVNDGIFHHAAFVRNGLTVAIYVDGNLSIINTNFGGGIIANINNTNKFRAGQSVCVSPGVSGVDNSQPFVGDLDELDLWQRALSPAEIHAIYAAGSDGKYSTNSLYPNFQVVFDGIATNDIILPNFAATNWQLYTNSFIATSNQTTIELLGNPLGVLLDDINLIQLPYTNYNNYYLPEEPLSPLIGQNPQGCWTLSIWDTRADTLLSTNGALLSWTLEVTTSSTNVNLIVLTNGQPYPATNLAGNGNIMYFGVDVPETANFATNILFNASGPMNLYFNQSSLPTGVLPGDVTLISLTNGGSNSYTLGTQGAPPPLMPGQRYFLGVQNTSTSPESFDLQVNFNVGNNTNIYALTNQTPVTTTIPATNGPLFYSFLVPTNAIMVTFQLLSPSNGTADLYARDSLPVPSPLSFDYESLNQGTNDQFIVITTNSQPVPLPVANTNDVLPMSPTTWYLSVYNPGTNTVGYTVLATYVTNVVTNNTFVSGSMTIINLNLYSNATVTNFTYTNLAGAPQGFPTNLLYSFTITNTNFSAVQFTVTNLSTNATNASLELLVGDGVFPTPEDFYSGSFKAGVSNQFVSIVTNSSLSTLSNIWYAAVPNVTTSNVPATIEYSITATVLTNAAVSSWPLFLGASITSPTNGFSMYFAAVVGQTYQIQVSTNLTQWSTVTNITAQSATAAYTDAVPVISQKSRFFRIVTP